MATYLVWNKINMHIITIFISCIHCIIHIHTLARIQIIILQIATYIIITVHTYIKRMTKVLLHILIQLFASLAKCYNSVTFMSTLFTGCS